MFKFDQLTWTTFEQSSFNIKAAADVSFKFMTGGGSGSSDEEKKVLVLSSNFALLCNTVKDGQYDHFGTERN